MNYSMFEDRLEQVKVPVQIEAMSVYQALEQVQDGRHKRGVRYRVALILTLILLAKLAGMTTPAAIAEWVRLRASWLTQVLPISRPTFPCAATYSNVLQAVDAEQVNEVVMHALTRAAATERCGEEPSRLAGQAPSRADCRDWRTARTVDKGHGRLEIRELVVSTELTDFLAGHSPLAWLSSDF